MHNDLFKNFFRFMVLDSLTKRAFFYLFSKIKIENCICLKCLKFRLHMHNTIPCTEDYHLINCAVLPRMLMNIGRKFCVIPFYGNYRLGSEFCTEIYLFVFNDSKFKIFYIIINLILSY